MNSFSNSHDYCDERGYVVPLYGYQYQKTSEESEEIFIIYQRAFASARGMVKLAHIKLSIAKCLLTNEFFPSATKITYTLQPFSETVHAVLRAWD